MPVGKPLCLGDCKPPQGVYEYDFFLIVRTWCAVIERRNSPSRARFRIMLMPATYVYSWRERSCLSDGRTVMDFVPQDRFQRGVRNSEPLLMLLKWLWMFPPIATKLKRSFVVGETVLKVKGPPCEDWKFVVAPVVGYRLFNYSRDFSDSRGRAKPVLLAQGFGLAPVLDLSLDLTYIYTFKSVI